MTKSIRFTKMHGAGNDYIYVNTMVYPIDNPEELSIAWSKPHTGIGSDGLVLIGSSDIADFSMHIYNADGSEAMMCGNASRCIGKYVYEAGLTQKNKVTLETLSGIKELQLKIEREEVTEITVDMGMPAVGEIALEVEAGGEIYTGTVISMGNPHLVIFVDEMDQADLASVGPLLECLPAFSGPDKRGVRAGAKTGRGTDEGVGTRFRHHPSLRNRSLRHRRGRVVRGKTKRKTKVIMDGGPLTIEWDERSGKVFMTGGAVNVFEGFIKV